MLETLTCITLFMIAFFTYQNINLGLTGKVPKDPKNRANFFAADCLSTIKDKLAGAKVEKLAENEVEFRSEAGTEKLWSADGHLWSQSGQQEPVKLHPLGQAGRVQFEKLSEHALLVKIHAEIDPQSQKDLGVRLEASFA